MREKVLYVTYPKKYKVRTHSFIRSSIAKNDNFFCHGLTSARYDLPADDIIRDENIYAILIDSPLYFYRNRPELSQYIKVGPNKFLDSIFQSGLPIVVFNHLDDAHGTRREFWEDLIDNNVYVISDALGRQTFDPDRKNLLLREDWLHEVPFFYENTEAIYSKYTLLPHAIDKAEFVEPLTFDARKYDVCVPGIGYWFRKKGYELLQSTEQFSMPPQRTKIDRVLGFVASRKPIARHIYFKKFQRQIALSRISITCDATVGYPIRKFFEIPAFGSALVGSFFPNSESLGFLNNVNCLMVSDPQEIIDAVSDLLCDQNKWFDIINAGRQLIMNYHLIEHRIEQILKICRAIPEKSDAEFEWYNGIFGEREPRVCSK